MARDFQRPFTPPAGAVELLLVRHGSSTATADASAPAPGLVDGHSDPPLSAAGLAQAERVAELLAPMLASAPAARGGAAPTSAAPAPAAPARLFVTPLRRTAQTAAPLAARLGVEPEVVHALREVHLGAWEGDLNRRLAVPDPLVRELFAAQRWDVIPGAEPPDAFGARVREGIEHVADAAGPGGRAVAVVHGGVIAEACRQATGSEPFAFLYAENGSLTRLLRLRGGRWTLRGFNDVAHLAALELAA